MDNTLNNIDRRGFMKLAAAGAALAAVGGRKTRDYGGYRQRPRGGDMA
jgi:hypothetical protein